MSQSKNNNLLLVKLHLLKIVMVSVLIWFCLCVCSNVLFLCYQHKAALQKNDSFQTRFPELTPCLPWVWSKLEPVLLYWEQKLNTMSKLLCSMQWKHTMTSGSQPSTPKTKMSALPKTNKQTKKTCAINFKSYEYLTFCRRSQISLILCTLKPHVLTMHMSSKVCAHFFLHFLFIWC